jgi:hypothetical protein
MRVTKVDPLFVKHQILLLEVKYGTLESAAKIMRKDGDRYLVFADTECSTSRYTSSPKTARFWAKGLTIDQNGYIKAVKC